MRSAALAALALAACGDNTSTHFGLDAGYADPDHSRFFGSVNGIGLTPDKNTALRGALVCIDAACVPTEPGGTFVIVGSGPGQEVTITASTAAYMTTIVPVIGGVTGDHNVEQFPLLVPELVASRASVFGVDPMLSSRGTVLVTALRYDTRTLRVAIDGMSTYYLDAQRNPDPTLTEMSSSGVAVLFAVGGDEAIIHTTAGHCEPAASGWVGDNGDVRVPIVAGEVTFVRLICLGE